MCIRDRLRLLAEQRSESAQQQKTRLKKLFGERNDRPELDEDADSEEREKDRRPNRKLDIIT